MNLDKDLRLYKNIKPDLIKYVKKEGIEKINSYAVLSGIPLIIVYTYIAEEFDQYKDFCYNKIEQLKQFYGIRD